MFRAPFDSFHLENMPPFVEQLMSPESLQKTGDFEAAAVARWRKDFRTMKPGSKQRLSVEMGLAGVVSTQLWHHMFIDPTLADLLVPTIGRRFESNHQWPVALRRYNWVAGKGCW